MILRLSLDLPEDGSYVRIARLLGRALLDALKVTEDDVADAEVLIGELCTNVIRHARDHDGRFQVVLEFLADRLLLTVIDTGVSFAFKDVPPAGTARPDTIGGGERIGGFGLGLIQALADRLTFHRTDPQGTTVRAEVMLHYQDADAAGEAARLDEQDQAEIRAETG